MIPLSEVIPRKLNFRPNSCHRRPLIGMLAHRLGWGVAGIGYPITLRQYASEPLDQGKHGLCEGCSHAEALYVALAAAGTPLPWVPSPLGIYTVSRCIERGGLLIELLDEGTESAYACAGINLWGVRAMRGPVQDPYDLGPRNCDADDTNINAEPNFADLEADSLNLFVGQYSAEGSSHASRLAAVNLALSRGYPVTIGGFVDTNYMRWESSDGVYPGADYGDSKGGGHSEVILSARVAGNEFEYEKQNSWGPWCDNGRVWVKQRVVLDADELTAVSVKRA